MYSNPPAHGCRIVDTVLKAPELFQEWRECIKTMANRIIRSVIKKTFANRITKTLTRRVIEYYVNTILINPT